MDYDSPQKSFHKTKAKFLLRSRFKELFSEENLNNS